MFDCCGYLREEYPNKVARPGATSVGAAEPYYDEELYEANSKSDRDKDKVACERS